MATYMGKNGLEISFCPASDQQYWGCLALLSQDMLDIKYTPEESRRIIMAAAIDEWSAAVRHGFICC